MCGIAGFVSIGAHSYPASVLERMTSSIAHRGPDGFGYFRDECAALGHRRLSIVDLSGGGQPMYNEDDSLVIVYNGEIFNHAGLREPLEQAGHRYRSRCDTEMLLHAYEQWGPESLSRYRGMFSYVLWDRNRRQLFGARDRLGIKPFYYYWDGRLFVFGSEIKALLEHPAVAARLNPDALAEYLAFGYLSDDTTLFANIRHLPPGCWLRLAQDGKLEIHRYWDAPKSTPATDIPEQEWIAECRRRMEETVRMRLMADVPLGVFLSGGVDSSAIAALMKRVSPDSAVKTFSVGYAETEFSELGYARQAAASLGTDHHEISISRDDFFTALPRLVWHEDEPITWPSSVSLYYVSQLAARDVKVVLTGEGSDELFAGYGRYRRFLQDSQWMQTYGMVPGPLRGAVRGFIGSSSLLPADLRRKLGHTILGRQPGLESLYLENYLCAFAQDSLAGLLRPNLRPRNAYDAYRHWWAEAGKESSASGSQLQRLLYTDQKTYLVELLRKQDRMSMACSIESRVPFLDHTFVEFASRVPESLRLHSSNAKYLLKKAVEDLLPHDIVYRRKMGFPTPLTRWLSGTALDDVAQLLQDPKGLLAEVTELPAVTSLLARHRNGFEDATDRIWRLLNLQLWGDMYLTGRRELRWEGALPVSKASR